MVRPKLHLTFHKQQITSFHHVQCTYISHAYPTMLCILHSMKEIIFTHAQDPMQTTNKVYLQTKKYQCNNLTCAV